MVRRRALPSSAFAVNKLREIEMAIEKGSAFLLKVGDGADQRFHFLARLRRVRFQFDAFGHNSVESLVS